ncbi:TetR/AcrR family transcriptional regulator [Kiloniella sp.]|uniref:TetR/AcrR family transcriptional regulator n=1 Tax=Kiloniella sp. TaxID=1938587 RepID=UPI003B01A403
MARVREFDEVEVLERAMRLFWKKGYAETSVRDLVDYTGVAHAGLYTAFGGKRELYQASLKHYSLTYGNLLFGPMEKPDACRAQVEEFFYFILRAVKAEKFQNGCMMCNTAVEFGNDEQDVLSVASANVERMTAALQNALKRALANGEVRGDLDPVATASFFGSVFYGIAVLSRSKADPERIEDTIDMALATLD